MFNLLAHEFRALFKNKGAPLLILFGIPILYTVLFGFLYSANSVKNIPLVIFDQDQTSTSRSLVQAFADSERYHIVAQVNSEPDLKETMNKNNAMAALVIPQNFSRDIKLSHATTVMMESNATNLMFANNVLSTSQEIVQTYAAAVGQKLVEGINQPPTQALKTVAPVRMSVRVINNPTASYSNFVLSGLTVNGIQLAIFMVSCTLLTKEYASLARRRELSSLTVIISKLVPCWLMSILSYLVCIGILVSLFGTPLRGSVLQLLLIGSAFNFAVASLGLFISAAAPNVLSAMQNSAIYIMSSFLCSGYSWPQFAMNSFGKAYAAILPITYAAMTIRDILLAAYAPGLLNNTLILIAFGGVFCVLSIAVFSLRRRRFVSEAQEELA
ncbi:MAG: hypothetical protein H6Q74_2508 [Firmicutes bacterium]|nr:hypothetical protein [Bacillota bacterium]